MPDSAIDFLIKAAAEREPGKRRVKVIDVEDVNPVLYGASDDEDDEDFEGSETTSNSEDINDDNDNSNAENTDETSGDDENSSVTSDAMIKEDGSVVGDNNQAGAAAVADSKGAATLPAGGTETTDKCAPPHRLVCCLCLNLRLHDEIVSCDRCGITVHEACYGSIADEAVSCTGSHASSFLTEPWFCDLCLATSKYPLHSLPPSCELCPNIGGAYKPTDTGRWVHLLCALYIPDSTFGCTERLAPVSLSGISHSLYGARECSLCASGNHSINNKHGNKNRNNIDRDKQSGGGDRFLARTGVCIKCDAGLCKAYFHVTCAQRAGLLCEIPVPASSSDEEDTHKDKGHRRHRTGDSFAPADNFYAGCKSHSQQELVFKRKHQYARLQLQLQTSIGTQGRTVAGNSVSTGRASLPCMNSAGPMSPREEDRLDIHQQKYCAAMASFGSVWIPSEEKHQRLLHTSGGCVRRMRQKVALLDEDDGAYGCSSNSIYATGWKGTDFIRNEVIGRSISLPPAFVPDFSTYYTEREHAIQAATDKLSELESNCERLRNTQNELNHRYDQLRRDASPTSSAGPSHRMTTLQALLTYRSCLGMLGCPSLPDLPEIPENLQRPLDVKTAAATPVTAHINMPKYPANHSSLSTGGSVTTKKPIKRSRSNVQQFSPPSSPSKKRSLPDSPNTAKENSARAAAAKRLKAALNRQQRRSAPSSSVANRTPGSQNAHTRNKLSPSKEDHGGNEVLTNGRQLTPVATRLSTDAILVSTLCSETAVFKQTVINIYSCAACDTTRDQHLLANCDTCTKHYHIGCLDPPLSKLPKKTASYGWECSNCSYISSSSETSSIAEQDPDMERLKHQLDIDKPSRIDVDAPRQLRLVTNPVERLLPMLPEKKPKKRGRKPQEKPKSLPADVNTSK